VLGFGLLRVDDAEDGGDNESGVAAGGGGGTRPSDFWLPEIFRDFSGAGGFGAAAACSLSSGGKRSEIDPRKAKLRYVHHQPTLPAEDGHHHDVIVQLINVHACRSGNGCLPLALNHGVVLHNVSK
jgi:hypothetical protein